MGVQEPPLGHPALRRAMLAVVKRGAFEQRPRLFIDKTYVTNMVLAVDKGGETLSMAMLWLMSYLFLLRLPSEVTCAHAHVKRSMQLWWPCGARRLCQPPSYDRSTRQQQNARRSCGARAKKFAYASSAGKTCPQAAASCAVSALAQGAGRRVQFTRCGTGTSPNCRMALSPGATSRPTQPGTGCEGSSPGSGYARQCPIAPTT